MDWCHDGLRKCRRVIEGDGGFPIHLHDLLERSRHCLDDAQVLRLKRLLLKYADVFLVGDLDKSCTNLVEHYIDTGNHRLIKLPARRMALFQHQEMEKVMEEYRR